MMHMSQKSIFIEPIQVEFEGAFRSCALISESECLVLTENKVIVVYLSDKTQKQLRFPQGVKGINGLSLNMIVDGIPCFIIATNQDGFDSQIKSDMEEQHPNQCHTIGDDNYWNWLLTVMQYNSVE